MNTYITTGSPRFITCYEFQYLRSSLPVIDNAFEPIDRCTPHVFFNTTLESRWMVLNILLKCKRDLPKCRDRREATTMVRYRIGA